MATPEAALQALKTRLEAEPNLEVRKAALVRVRDALAQQRADQRQAAVDNLTAAAQADPTYGDLRLSDVRQLTADAVTMW